MVVRISQNDDVKDKPSDLARYNRDIDIHKEFLSLNLSTQKSTVTLIYEVKGMFPENIIDSRF